jgi:ribose-phosphate pyrophosphokinase
MGREVAELLGKEPVLVEHREFPDGESHLRVAGDVGGRDVVLVHSTAPPQDVRMVQLLFTLDVLREEAESITVVVPYLAYARQDRRQAPGEAVSISTVIRLLSALGVSKLVTVNVHNPAQAAQCSRRLQAGHRERPQSGGLRGAGARPP